MLAFDRLDGIAKQIAYSPWSPSSDDIYQATWERFLRYPPPNATYAYQSARSARADWWRKERRQEKLVRILVGLEPGVVRRQRVVATLCRKGHEFTPGNTYYRRRGRVIERRCLECQRQCQRRNYRKTLSQNADKVRARNRERVRRHRERKRAAACAIP